MLGVSLCPELRPTIVAPSWAYVGGPTWGDLWGAIWVDLAPGLRSGSRARTWNGTVGKMPATQLYRAL